MPETTFELLQLLQSTPPGVFAVTAPILEALTRAWTDLKGSSETNMTADKLSRIKDLRWDRNFLRFEIDRHGGTVNGSSRADVHTWKIDPFESTATIVSQTHKQLEQMDARMDVNVLAAKIVGLILSGCEDPRIKWMRDGGSVCLVPDDIIPPTNKRTTAGRRRRFRNALTALLKAEGWKEVRRNRYRPV